MNFKVFPGNYGSLQKISNYIKTASHEAGFDGFTTYTIETAVDEACSNIIEHAYGGENKGNIEISIVESPKQLTIYIRDYGSSFNPEKVPIPSMSKELKDHKANGLGLYMMRQWMDEIDFKFGEKSNLLKMVKYKEG